MTLTAPIDDRVLVERQRRQAGETVIGQDVYEIAIDVARYREY